MAAACVGTRLARSSDRGLQEKDFAATFKECLDETYRGARLADRSITVPNGERRTYPKDLGAKDWEPLDRKTSELDLVVRGEDGQRFELVGELKVWEIEEQLFDLAKCCCLLGGNADAAFLAYIGDRPECFERAGGELFPAKRGERREHEMAELRKRHPKAWKEHVVRRPRPGPTRIPRRVATTAVCEPVTIQAYPGHELRVVLVEVLDDERLCVEER